MAWGETDNRLFSYSVGPFNGDGHEPPERRRAVRLHGATRSCTRSRRPSIPKNNPIRDMQIGGSFHYGSRDKKWVDYDYPAMTTQGAYAFWTPTYAGSERHDAHHPVRRSDRGSRASSAIPFDRFDLTGEFVYIKNNTREALEGFEATNTERFGDIKGISYYAQLGYWIFGKRDINGLPGYENPPKLNWSQPRPERARHGAPDPREVGAGLRSTTSRRAARASPTRRTSTATSRSTRSRSASTTGRPSTSASRSITSTISSPTRRRSRPTLPRRAAAERRTNRALAPGNTLAPGSTTARGQRARPPRDPGALRHCALAAALGGVGACESPTRAGTHAMLAP